MCLDDPSSWTMMFLHVRRCMYLFCGCKERIKDRRYGSRIVKRYCVEASCHLNFENGRVYVRPLLQEKGSQEVNIVVSWPWERGNDGVM